MRLAAKLGYANPDYMLSTMTARHLLEWQKMFQTEPFGDEWRQTARLAAAVTAPHLKRGHKVKEEDYMPVRQQQPSHDELRGKMRTFFGNLAAVRNK